MSAPPLAAKFQPYTQHSIVRAPQWRHLDEAQREAVQVLAHVLPFRTNAYVMEHLIDWANIPDDPIFRLTFPRRAMLPEDEYLQLRELLMLRREPAAIAALVRRIRLRMNPHPAG